MSEFVYVCVCVRACVRACVRVCVCVFNLMLHAQHVSKKKIITVLGSNNLKRHVMYPNIVTKPQALYFTYRIVYLQLHQNTGQRQIHIYMINSAEY